MYIYIFIYVCAIYLCVYVYVYVYYIKTCLKRYILSFSGCSKNFQETFCNKNEQRRKSMHCVTCVCIM